jgi:hypothetical protein
MNFLKTFGEVIKKLILWILSNIGDVLVMLGLAIIPVTTFFVSVIIGFYVLAITLIVIGIIYIKSKGGE